MQSALCNSLAPHCSSTWCPAPPAGPYTSRLVRCPARHNDKGSVRAARTAAPDKQALPSDAAAVAEALGLAVPVRRTSRRGKQQQQQQAGKHSQPKQQHEPHEQQQQQPAPPQPQLQQGVQDHQTPPAQDKQQQQQQQQPCIVLTPLQTAAAATGSALRSSALGSWSAVGPWSPAAAAAAAGPTTSPAAGTRQQQQAASQLNLNRLAGPADKHRARNQHTQQGSRQEGVSRGPQGFQQQSRQRVTGRRQGPPKQQPQQQAGPLLDASWHDLKGRQMTGYLSSASSVSNLFTMVQNCSGSQAFNLVHVSTAYKVLADLTTRQQPRQEHEALQPAEEPREQLLLLLDRLTASQIMARTSAAAAAAVPGSTSSSSSRDSPQRGSRVAVGQPAAGRYVRSLSGIVHGCARIRHKLSWDTLLLLLDEFLLAAEQQQQQQLQQMDQHSMQQKQHSSQRGSSNSGGGGDGSSSGSADGSHQQPQAMCHALSLLCWGLSKAGFTCTSVYELSSSDQEQEQQLRLEQQQQYWQRLAAAGVHLVQYGSTRDISTLCYAFATGGYKDVALWGRLGPKVVSCLHSFTPQEFAQTLWAFATADAEFRPLITEACLVAPQLAPGFTAQGLVNVLWALTALNGSVPPQLLAVTEDVCLRRDLDRFGSVNLAVLIAAHVRSGSMRIELAVAVNRAVIRTLPSFSAENLCRVVSGLAVLNCLQQPLMEVVVPRLLKHLRYGTVDVQTACHGVWGVAVTDPSRALELLPAMLQLATKHIHILTRSSDSTSKLCSALSLARFRDDAFMDRLSSFLLGAGPTGSTASPTAAAAGGSTAPVGSGTGMSMVSSAASGSSRVRAGSPLDRWQHRSVPQHLVSMASAMARLGFSQHTALLQLVIQQYLERLQSPHSSGSSTLQQQQAVLLLWACAVLDMQEPVQLLQQLLSLLKGVTDLPTASLAQLVQVHMWLQAVGPSGGNLAAKIPKALLQNALHVWQQQLVPVVVLSELHREVLGQLTAMQLKPVAEALTADGMFSVDIMVQHKGCTVALEVLGPEHYTANKVTPIVAASQQQRQDQEQQQQHVLMGPDLLRFRLLAARGFALAAVSSFEAAGAVSTPAGAKALRQLLQQKLSEAVDLHQQQLQQQEATPQPSQDTSSTILPASYPPSSSKAQARRGRRKEGKQDSTQQQPGQQSHGALSRFALQPGFSDAQDRMRRNRAVHLEQRSAVQQQQELGRRRTEAMQTLLSAAASKDGSSDAAKGDAAVPFADASASLDEQFEGLMVDEDFDIPLDLNDLSLPESKP